ncbi:putative transcription factor C2H2 family [Helianthus anomalus]
MNTNIVVLGSIPSIRKETEFALLAFMEIPSQYKATIDNQLCSICLTNIKDVAFGCGHQTCYECEETLERSLIQTII